jgi:hypothetical protein
MSIEEIVNLIIALASLLVTVIAGIYIPLYIFRKQHHLEQHLINMQQVQKRSKRGK